MNKVLAESMDLALKIHEAYRVNNKHKRTFEASFQ